MSDRLPYEEQLAKQWNDLPLPDENMAWEDMKRRLEEDDDDGIIPVWLRGCGLWGLLLVVLFGLGWWLIRQHKTENKKEQPVVKQEAGVKKNKEENGNTIPLIIDKTEEKIKDTKVPVEKINERDILPVNKQIEKDRIVAKKEYEILKENKKTTNKKKKKTELTYPLQQRSDKSLKVKKEKQIVDKNDTGVIPESKLQDDENNKERIVKRNNPDAVVKNSADSISLKEAIRNTINNIVKAPAKTGGLVSKDNIPKKDSAKQKSILFSAGIALHQLVPVDGQKLNPYNSQGRKGSIGDYIPSVYFRVHKEKKWFLQSEFRYGAPQYTREIVYQQKIVRDTFNTTATTTSARLKKTFYHQLPVSFNYFVLPDLSIGGGFVWNSFNSAVSEQDVVRRFISTGVDSVLSKGVILNNMKADSNFARSYFQALVEAQYQWKRFSFGARYSFGLQPYLKFQLPGGTQQSERNRSLQLFIRYELWKSRAKR